jgi:hypothetical protein
MISAMIPTCIEEDGWWRCFSRCIWGAGLGFVTGTGATRKAAYADWIAEL